MPKDDAAAKDSSGSRMDFRLGGVQKALIEKAAAYSGESLTGFAVSTLVREARRVIEEHEAVVTLSTRDRERFVALLDSPPVPNEALRRAAERYPDVVARSE